ncbi:hypothetical protein [Paenibacillus sp. YPG26]|uniref:hypothetical protein n=1 Tax=Paenibacillus sp. YPG26 TaxID=2878915 RepID=UPI00203E2DA0|nr:hypothetical protein [Paenibacillus sp. YPG26]USB33548.1 hypothetical protein LDO05_01590 [Paenibacillus sp. YPG26]
MTTKKWIRLQLAGLLCIALSLGGLSTWPSHQAEAAGKYSSFDKVSVKGPAIPGLSGNKEWVPQGLAVVPSKNWVITSHYWGSGGSTASAIAITSTTTNKRLKTLYLYESSTKKHTGHAGGLAVSKSHLWIATGKTVYKIPLSTLSSKKDYSNVIMKGYALGHKASYATYAEGVLWVGGYMDGEDIGKKMCDPGPKGRAYGYKLSSKDDLPSKPKAAYSWATPDRVQGMALTKSRALYSQSCGRNNSSKLLVYTRGASGKQVSYLTMPPMSEGIALSGSQLYTLFESGARKYSNGSLPLKNMYIINTKKLKM